MGEASAHSSQTGLLERFLGRREGGVGDPTRRVENRPQGRENVAEDRPEKAEAWEAGELVRMQTP